MVEFNTSIGVGNWSPGFSREGGVLPSTGGTSRITIPED